MASLKELLFDEYGGFSDQRIKHLDKGTRFTVDDRSPADFGAADQLYATFCAMSVDVSRPEPLTPEVMTVDLIGNVPDSPGVRSWVGDHQAEYRTGPRAVLRFQVAPGEQSKLLALAKEVEAIVAPGADRYSVPSYKFVCPRTARSLERLARVLDQIWRPNDTSPE